ncbi:MAG: PIN domain-containing protein [Parvibaculales bacterium]
MTINVFIDTNILLNFFHFSKDEIDALNKVFAPPKHSGVKVYLTEQVRDEFKRNRESRINDALKRFEQTVSSIQLPSFMKDYEEFDEIKKISKELQTKSNAILEKAHKDISEHKLLADERINEIFRPGVIETTDEIYNEALKRVTLGNPPGKNNSIGDAINWTILLKQVPDGEDLHIISEDDDFYSSLDKKNVHPFLKDEWEKKKKSELKVYKTLGSFLKEHFGNVTFSFDDTKNRLIDALNSSRSFFMTHNIISQLEKYKYFSLEEVERILFATVANEQILWIITDPDVSDFLNRVAVPRINEITDEVQKNIIESIIRERSAG